MRKLFVLLAFCAIASAQSVLDNFTCAFPSDISQASPAVVTCPETLEYVNRHAEGKFDLISGKSVTDGMWFKIGATTYTYKATIDNATPYEILLGTNKFDNLIRAYHAINDDGVGKGTEYSSATIANPDVIAEYPTYDATFGATYPSTFDLVNNQINWKNHKLTTGDDLWLLSNESTDPSVGIVSPIAYNTEYWAIVVDADHFKLAASQANALAGTAITLTAQHTGVLYWRSKTCPTCLPPPIPDNGQSVYMYVLAKQAGLAGAGLTLSTSTSNTLAWTRSKTQVVWYVYVTGLTGDWAGLGSDATPQTWVAQLIDSTHFGLYTMGNAAKGTNLAPYTNSTYSGSGQHAMMQRGSGDSVRTWYPDTGDLTPFATTMPTANHELVYNLPSCTTATGTDMASGLSEADCSKAYQTPDNQKAYGGPADIANPMVCDASTCTITLRAPYVQTQGFPDLAAGASIFVRGFQNYSALKPYMAKGAQRIFYVRTLDANKQTLTINNPDPAHISGSYNGTCAGGACVGSAHTTYPYIALEDTAIPYLYYVPRDHGYLWPATTQWWQVPDQWTDIASDPNGFDPDNNRFSIWIKNSRNVVMPPDGSYSQNWGTYPLTSEQWDIGAGSHFYHYGWANEYANQWHLWVFNAAPSHQVNESGAGMWPNEPTHDGHALYPKWGSNRDGVTAPKLMQSEINTYLDWENHGYSDWSGAQLYFAKPTFSKVLHEPDEAVRTRSGVWSPNLYVNGVLSGKPGYEITWVAPPLVGLSYEVRYSLSGSLEANGWFTGSTGGTIDVPDLSIGKIGFRWRLDSSQNASVASQQPEIWVGIRPTYPIQSLTGTTSAWINTQADTALQVGDTVTVGGVSGTVTAVQPRRNYFRHKPDIWQGSPFDGQLVSIQAASGTCTATFTSDPGLISGWSFYVVGSGNSNLGDGASYPYKYYKVGTVTDSTHFTFACPAVSDGTWTSDSSLAVGFALSADPGVQVSAGVSMAGATTIESTMDKSGFAEVDLPLFTPDGTAPAAPSSLAATTTTGSTQVQLSWTDNATNEDSFQMQRQINSGAWENETAFVIPRNSTSFTDYANLSAGDTVNYRLVAINSVGASTVSNTATVTVGSGVSDVLQASPGSLTFTATTDGSNPTGQSVSVSASGTLDNWSADCSGAAWLTCSPTTGAAAGSFTVTPDITGLTAGTYTATISVSSTTNGITGSPQSINVTLTVSDPPAVQIGTSSLPNGKWDSAYSQSLSAASGTAPYTWSVIGTLPSGMSLDPSTGLLSGTPLRSGTFTVIFSVIDSGSPATSDSQSLTFTISGPQAAFAVGGNGVASGSSH